MEAVKAVALVGGWAHPGAVTGPALSAALDSLDVETVVVESFDAATERLHTGVDLLVVHACRFQMTDARYSDEQRRQFASTTPPNFREAVTRHLAAGRSILGLHTAALCFDDWPDWHALLGAHWDWQRSNHPPPASFTVDAVADSMTGELGSFEVFDELYRFVEASNSSSVVASATDTDGVTHPVAWTTQLDAGRTAFSSLGHDDTSLANPNHRRLLKCLIAWLDATR
jgi:uncharacterized protein